ncbi:titin homolog [Anastrepha ludens]|uniref:titin homolog n=1 Tax=Anastrepha ludens TaxID=28586 RepID=UPI0023AF73DA|nr:titin homolog [Anastrepha ludens]XP_053951106.1 titin homolog [Anastrepha ludens]XP_053951108.1 titin homolog [Anastrepha ludens]
MSDDRVYKDGDIVWVKLGNNWWPGEVTGVQRQPEGLLKHLKKKPYCVVKFFQEDAYEYIKSAKQIFPFQCSKKDEFIKKGTALYNAKNKFMEKFPSDVEIAERLTRKATDLLIINDRPDSIVKAILGPTYTRCSSDYYDTEYNNSSCNTDYNNKRRSGDSVTKILNITPQRTSTATTTAMRTPETVKSLTSPLITPNYTNTTNSIAASSANTNFYRCNLCNFSSQRQNVMIMHRRTHSGTGTPASAAILSRKTTSATITTTSAAKLSTNSTACTTPPPTTSSKDTSNFLSEDVERKCQETIRTGAAPIPKSANSAAPVNSRSASAVKNRPQLSTVEGEGISRGVAGSSRPKLRSSLRIDADVTEITLPDGMPVGASKEDLKLTDDDTTDNSSSPTTEELLRACSPRKHNIDVSDTASNAIVLNSTAEEIRQRLLADWSDGEKEDEMVNDFKKLATRSATPPTNAHESEINKLAVQADVIKKDEPIVYGMATPISSAICNNGPQTSNQNRIRNIPKKDRRDAVLKEFINDYTVESPAAVVNLESINCSSSNSSDSVVVVAVVPPNSETIVVDDNGGTDGEAETSGGEIVVKGTEIPASDLPFNVTKGDQNRTVGEDNAEVVLKNPTREPGTELQEIVQAKVEKELVEYIQRDGRNDERRKEEFHAERLKNGEQFVLMSGELAKDEVVSREEMVRSSSSEESDRADLKEESKVNDINSEIRKQSTKQRSRDKASKFKRRQKATNEAPKYSLETPTKEEHLSNEQFSLGAEESNMPRSPQRLKEEERPLTSLAAAQQQLPTDCFDFQEEEDDTCSDALKSIADFKKKYLSPEKSQDKAQADNGLPSESERRRSTEQKDQQLAYDIEKLLEQATAPSIVDAAIPAAVARTHSFGSSKEELPVKGLPIKERGKRIFKSRNRSRIDETSPLAGVGMENVVPAQIMDIVEPNVTVENQLQQHKQIIGERDHEEKVGQYKEFAGVERADEYEKAQPSDAPPAPAVQTTAEKMEGVETLEIQNENEGNAEIVKKQFDEEPTVLKVKTVNNGVLSTPTAKDAAGHASAEDKQWESRGLNGENIDNEEKSEQTVTDEAPSNGDDFESTTQIAEEKVEENNSQTQEGLSDQIANAVQPESEHENGDENSNRDASEGDNLVVVQEDLMEQIQENAAHEMELSNESVSNEIPDMPIASNETTAETNFINTQAAIDKEESEVELTELPARIADPELVHEAEDSLAATLKNDIAEEQHDIALISEEVPQSRLTSPTDDNSSICISEAGAEFGSPTSMLDDERLPTITGRLMTPTDALIDAMPAGSEDAKALEVEQQTEIIDELQNGSGVQNDAVELAQETTSVDVDDKTGEIEYIEGIPMGEITTETFTAEEDVNPTENKGNELIATIAEQEDTEIQEASKELLLEEAKHVEKADESSFQDACDITDIAEPCSGDENNRDNNQQDSAENEAGVDGAHNIGDGELVNTESEAPEMQNETAIPAEASGEVESEANNKEPASELVHKIIEEQVEGIGNVQNAQVGNAAANMQVEDQSLTDNTEQRAVDEVASTARQLNSIEEVVPTEESVTEIIEHVENEESDMDDDFIESPPHEPLSGHEGDAELLSAKTKVLTKTQKRRTITAIDNTNTEESTQSEDSVERRRPTPTYSEQSNVSPKHITEFTKETSSRRRQTRATKQQQSKSNDFMKELDLSDLHEATTKEESEEKVLTKPLKTTARQRKGTKISKLTAKVNEQNEKPDMDIVTTEVVAIEQQVVNEELATAEVLNERTQTPNEAELTEPLDLQQYGEQSNDAIVAAIKSGGSSRKRRSATIITPRRNASGTPNTNTRESELADKDEPMQRAKTRKLEESSNIDNTANVETFQTTEELNASIDMDNCESLIEEVDESELIVEDNEGANMASPQLQLQSNDANSPLVVEEEQCIIQEVYLNDTMSMQQIAIETSANDNTATVEDAAEATVSEINSFRPHDVPNAVEYVDYASIEHQQPIEEVIVSDANTVEAATECDTLQSLNTSTNNANVTLNQRRASTRDAQPTADNVCINISPMEKVRINVDVANPLSTQIANILATKSAGGAASTAVKHRKANLEESIPSFIIERPGQAGNAHQQHASTSGLEFTIGEQDAVAHVQQMCPQVKITRKEKFIEEPLTADNVVQQDTIVATSGAMFDISNMPIVLGNEHFMSAQGDMQIVLTSSAEAETSLRTDGPQILQQQILQPAYRSSLQAAQQRQRKRSTDQQQQQQVQQTGGANCQVGSNKHGIIIIKAAPSDLIIQQSPTLQVTQQQAQAIAAGGTQQLSTSPADATTMYNLGSGVTLRPIAEPKQKQQQRQQQQKQQIAANKSKSPAAAATGGRKQAGNTITLPSSITVKQRQQKVTDGLTSAAATGTTTKATTSEQQQLTQSASVSGNKAQKRNHPTNSRRSQTQIVQQRRLTATASSLVELQRQQEQQHVVDGVTTLLHRRLSYTEAHAPSPAKISRSADKHSESTFAATAEQQLLQLQQQQHLQQQRQKVQSPTTSVSISATQPPPLHPLHNRKRHSSQQQRRMSTKSEVTHSQTQSCAQEQQQQQLQRLQPTQMVLLEQQQHQCLEQAQQQEQHVAAVHITELAASPSASDVIPAEYEAVQLQEEAPEVYTEEILAEEFEANEHTPSVIAVPSQPVPGYPDTLLLCRRVDEEWIPVVAQPFYYTRSDQQLRPIPKEVLIGRPILTPSTDKATEFPVETEEVQTVSANDAYKEETGVTILIGNNYVHMEWDQFLEVMRSNDDVYNLRAENGHVFQLTRDALVTLQQDANLQEKYRQLQQLLEEQQLEEQQQLEQQELIQQQFIQQLQTVTVTGEEGLETDMIPLLHIDTTQTLQLIGTDDGNLILQPALAQPPLSPPCTRPALTNATNALLNQTPIMSPLEKPSTAAAATTLLADSSGRHIDLATATSPEQLVAAGFIAADTGSAMPACRPTLGDSLAVIGVVPTQPTLLPTTVTNPAIAPPKSDLIPNMTTAAQMHAQYRHAQRAIYNDPGS